MVSAIISRFVLLTVGTLYPAYRSYKGVKTKDVREYVKWMMYWIVFAIFLCVEALADIFVAFWCPFYYELKCVFVVWLLSPYTRGASLLYRKFVHPFLLKHEPEIDLYLERMKRESYTRVVQLGNRGVNYAKEAVAMAALRGHEHIVGQIRKTVSLNDVTDSRIEERKQFTSQNGLEEEDDEYLGIPSEMTLKQQRVRRVKQRPALLEARGARLQALSESNVSESSTMAVDLGVEASSLVEEEFGYLNEEDEDYCNDQQDTEEYAGDTVVSTVVVKKRQTRRHDSYTDDPSYDPKLVADDGDKFATMPRRSQRKVVKKE